MSDTPTFADALLEVALDHHERHWVNGEHDSANCELCRVLIRLSVEMRISLADLKLEAMPAEGTRRS